MQFSIWEDDTDLDPCIPNDGRPPEVDNGVVDNYAEWGARPVTSVTSGGGTYVIGIDTLQLSVALADEAGGNDDDEVGELHWAGGSCWPEDGSVKFELYLSESSHTNTGEAFLDFRYGERDPVCQSPPPPPYYLDVTIDGPTTVPPDQYCWYNANASGGTGSYSYQWYRNGFPIGTGPSASVYTGDVSSVVVRVDVTDSGGGVGSDEVHATVSSEAPPCFN